MRLLICFLLIFLIRISFGQSEHLVPKEAVTILSLNNTALLEKISLDELVNYDFMADIHQEIFDGSTQGKTIQEAGIDFNQKLNIFFGKSYQHEVSGFTFGVENKEQLFQAFDDFESVDSKYENVEHYVSYFNQLFIQNNSAILLRVSPNEEFITRQTDSIWYARGNEYPWYELEHYEQKDTPEEMMEEVEEGEEYYEDVIFSDDSSDTPPPPPSGFPEAEMVDKKTYFELQDSIRFEYEQQFIHEVCRSLFSENSPLIVKDKNFAKQVAHSSDGILYLDNSRNLLKEDDFTFLNSIYPSLAKEIENLYTGNSVLGDIFLRENAIDFNMQANYSDELGSIYKELNDSKFDKSILQYIHHKNTAFITCNMNMRNAYEQAYKVFVPILEKEKNPQIISKLITLELLNEFIDKDALFGTYKGSMFLSYNGIQKVNTRKIEYTYDEETFEYEQKEVKVEEDMPIFAFGFSTDREDIPNKILKHLEKLDSLFIRHEKYWEVKDAILDASPLYLINRNGLFIFTNDKHLVENHSDGFGKSAIRGKRARKIKKNGFLYSEIDWKNTIDQIPSDVFTEEQNEILDEMRGKTGKIKLTSSATSSNGTDYHLRYSFNGEYDNAGKYILDLINSIYLISK